MKKFSISSVAVHPFFILNSSQKRDNVRLRRKEGSVSIIPDAAPLRRTPPPWPVSPLPLDPPGLRLAGFLLQKMKPYKRNDPFYTSAAWRAVREQALIRDHYICQKCQRKADMGLIFRPNAATMVHHLKPRSQYPELELDLDNLESLCDACHNEEHPERGFKIKPAGQTQSGRRCVKISNERSMDKDVRY